MTEYSIFRKLTDAEKQGVITLEGRRNKDILNTFLADLAKTNAKYQKMYQPFDSYSARIDFDEGIKKKMTELSATLDKSKISPNIDFGDLDEYGNPDRFEFVKRTDVLITKLVAGIKNEVEIGKRFHFVAKQRGNKFSMFVPEEDVKKVEKWVSVTYNLGKKEDKKDEVKEDKE